MPSPPHLHLPLHSILLPLLLLLLLLLPRLTTPHPLIPSPLTYTTNCLPKRRIFTPCPNYYDCATAIFLLPSLEGSGAFHNGAPDDVFRLPVERTHASCRVRVELVHEGTSKQEASWHVVVARALRVNEVCINTRMRETENMGGWTAMGKQERLVVILEYSGSGEGVGGTNVTVV